MLREPVGKKIIHVSAWADAIWHFRMPIVRQSLKMFDRVVVYCSERQYCRTSKDALSADGHIRRLMNEGVEVKVGPIDKRPSLRIPFQIWALYRYLRSEKFDIIMTHQPMGSLVGITAAFLARTKLRIYSTGGLRHIPGKGGLTNFVHKVGETILIRMAHAVFLVNREDAEHLRSLGFSEKKVIYVGPSGGCGVDTEIYNSNRRLASRKQSRAELELDDDTIVVGYSGRCVWEKGFREMIESAEMLKISNPELKLKFVIVGTGVDLSAIKDFACQKKVDQYFLFLGYKFDVDYYVSAFDINILPSYREGLPIALLEGMAMGLPCIASNIRGCRELIRDGQTGILISPSNAGELADAINQLVRSPHDAHLVGRAAEQSVSDNYAQKKLVVKTMNTVEALINERLQK